MTFAIVPPEEQRVCRAPGSRSLRGRSGRRFVGTGADWSARTVRVSRAGRLRPRARRLLEPARMRTHVAERVSGRVVHLVILAALLPGSVARGADPDVAAEVQELKLAVESLRQEVRQRDQTIDQMQKVWEKGALAPDASHHQLG